MKECGFLRLSLQCKPWHRDPVRVSTAPNHRLHPETPAKTTRFCTRPPRSSSPALIGIVRRRVKCRRTRGWAGVA
eukprot:3941858-Rhodomonas_salina.2